MNIAEARERVVDELFARGEFTPENYWVLEKPEDDEPDTIITNEQSKSIRISSLAKKMGMWVEAEVLYQDPILEGTPFAHDNDRTMSFLGMEAAKHAEFDQAYYFFERIKKPVYEYEVHIVDALIQHGRLQEAEKHVRRADFSVMHGSSMQDRLATLVNAMSNEEGGPAEALALVNELVPDPETSKPENLARAKSRMDYFVDTIAVQAAVQGDLETARQAIAKMYKSYGPGAAGGGGGIDYQVAELDSPSVKAQIKLLQIERFAGVGSNDVYTKSLLDQLDEESLEKILSYVPEWRSLLEQ